MILLLATGTWPLFVSAYAAAAGLTLAGTGLFGVGLAIPPFPLLSHHAAFLIGALFL